MEDTLQLATSNRVPDVEKLLEGVGLLPAHVDRDGQVVAAGELELLGEDLALNFSIRIHVVEVEAALADGDHARYWEAISGVVTKPVGRWVVVDNYEPGVAQKVSFRQYDTKFHEGGTAYVAHCGAGFTCNALAEEVLKNYPDVGSPGVYCGEVPHILDNPQAAPIN